MITWTYELVPREEHANDDGDVRAFNAEKNRWENRHWSWFPTDWHQLSRGQQRTYNWPKWSPLPKLLGPPGPQGLPLVIVHHVPDAMQPQLFKTRSFLEASHATPQELNDIGLGFVEARGDKLHIECVTETLYDALPAHWLRP